MPVWEPQETPLRASRSPLKRCSFLPESRPSRQAERRGKTRKPREAQEARGNQSDQDNRTATLELELANFEPRSTEVDEKAVLHVRGAEVTEDLSRVLIDQRLARLEFDDQLACDKKVGIVLAMDCPVLVYLSRCPCRRYLRRARLISRIRSQRLRTSP